MTFVLLENEHCRRFTCSMSRSESSGVIFDNFIPVTMAEGSHPFPFRTRPLSPPAPMVLPGSPGGRVGRCRDSSSSMNPDGHPVGVLLLGLRARLAAQPIGP